RMRPDWLNTIASMSNAWYAGVYVPQEEAFRVAHEDRRILQPVKLIELEHHPRFYFAEHIESIRDAHDFVTKLGSARFPLRTAYIDVETQGRAFLAMSVTPQKYWRVTIDGYAAEPILTNLGFQGVIVPAA